MRFFAAIGVVCHHFGWQAFSHVRGASTGVGFAVISAMKTGYVGVSFFFVLSGFILAYVYLNTDGSLRGNVGNFWLARLARVYPGYLFAMCLLMLPALRYEDQRVHLALHLTIVTVLLQSWFPSLAMIWNPPAWSLSAEAFFYVLFPVFAVAIAQLDRRSLYGVLFVFWLASLTPPAVYMAWNPDGLPASWLRHGIDWAFTQEWHGLDVVRFEPIFQLPQFLLGVGTACLFAMHRADRGVASHVALLGWVTGAAIVIALCLGPKAPYVLMFNGLLAPLFALFIYVLAWNQGKLAAFFLTRYSCDLEKRAMPCIFSIGPSGNGWHDSS